MTSPLRAADPLLFLVVVVPYRAGEILSLAESRVQHAMNSWAREARSTFGHLNENINSIYLAHLLITGNLNISRRLKCRSLLQTIASGILRYFSSRVIFFAVFFCFSVFFRTLSLLCFFQTLITLRSIFLWLLAYSKFNTLTRILLM